MNCARVASHIVKWLSDYAEAAAMDGFVVGVSGGIDSAVTSTLCAMTGKPTLCLDMPIHQAPTKSAGLRHTSIGWRNRIPWFVEARSR